jgi:hypothetical protein
MPRSDNPTIRMLARLTWIPLTVGLMCFPSTRYVVLLVDGPDTDAYGFPIPWNSRSISTSLAKDVYLVPLAIDLAIYVWLSIWLCRRLVEVIHKARLLIQWSVLLLLWVYGFVSALLLFAVFVAFDTSVSIWYQFPVAKVVSASLHLAF